MNIIVKEREIDKKRHAYRKQRHARALKRSNNQAVCISPRVRARTNADRSQTTLTWDTHIIARLCLYAY